MSIDSGARALGAIALFLVAGIGWAACLPGFAKSSVVRRAAFAFLLGVAWIGTMLYLLSHFGGVRIGPPVVLATAIVPMATAATLAAASRRPPLPRRGSQRGGSRRLALAWLGLSLLTSVVCIALFGQALTRPLDDWDGRMTWAAQAAFVREAGSVDAEVLRSPRTFVSHPRYPLLMPLAQVAALEATRSDEERVFRAVYAAFLPAFIVLVATAGSRWAGSRAALLTTLASVTIPWIAFEREGGAMGAYSDLPLACFFGAGLLLLVQARPRPAHGLAAGLLLAAAALTKNEGLPEALAVLLLAGASAVSARRRRAPSARARALATAVAAIVVFAALVLLASWRSSIPNRYDEAYFETFSLPSLLRGISTMRALPTLSVMIDRMLSPGPWGLFWWLAPVIILAGAPRWKRPPTALLLTAAATPVVLAWFAYSQVATPAYYAGVTWNRILLQAAVPLFCLLALAIRNLLALAVPLREEGSASGSAWRAPRRSA